MPRYCRVKQHVIYSLDVLLFYFLIKNMLFRVPVSSALEELLRVVSCMFSFFKFFIQFLDNN